MAVTLVLTNAMAEELRGVATGNLESAAVLLVSVVPIEDGGFRVLGRELHWVSEGSYVRRSEIGLTVTSEGYVEFLRRAEQIHATAIWLHTHPGEGASPKPSYHDGLVDRELLDLFKIRSASDNYGALIVSVSTGSLAFTGHLNTQEADLSIDRIWIVGDRFAMIFSADSEIISNASGIFDRNIRAFGGGVQHVLNQLSVGIVGCGGTGSAVAEQLVRLGVRNVILIDPDELSESNVTRVYGSTAMSVGDRKTEILATHLRSIAPDMIVETVTTTINVLAAARRLRGCDLVWGCTDDNAGRLVLSRFSFFYLTPVIDCGVQLVSDSTDIVTGIFGRVTILSPGSACLVCRDRIDLRRAQAELLTPEERRRLEDEGYAPALGQVEPSVVTYTTLVAALAVGELLERLIGYGPLPVPNEIIVRCHDRELSTNIASPRPRHYCHPESGRLGIGDIDPYLDQTWAA